MRTDTEKRAMTIHFRCAQCDGRLRAVDRLVGRQVLCPRCRASLRVPEPGGGEPAVQPGPAPAPPEPAAPSTETSASRTRLPKSRRRGRLPHTDRIVLDAEDLAEPARGRATPGALSLNHADLDLTAEPRRPKFSDGLAHVGKVCPFCQSGIAAEDRVAACALCGIPHHLECWHENGGCTTFGCEAAPMPLMARAGMAGSAWRCPYCGGAVDPAARRCGHCGAVLRPPASRTRRANPGADKALAVAFLSVPIPLLVPLAIWLGGRALQYAEEAAETEGVRTARAAVLLATVAGVIWIAVLFALLSAM